MFLKVLKWIGVAACIAVIVSCFLPWVYFADLQQHFTGFYSYNNEYGKPGKFLLLMVTAIMVFSILPRLWAKRTNLFLSALTLAYAVKSYILFGSCYNNYCPQKEFGIYLMLVAMVVVFISTIFPDMKLKTAAKD